ncbi:MAG TPA: MarR family winged helix-turn-helix transcriptional regulator [Streptosporangiaceae bacterium]|jgi:DNA-binding MarR family transcriptional regulator|nr:MarR family winged helix-turn-helix transcriptional regulator [Streptosporangiaceae bacterium]
MTAWALALHDRLTEAAGDLGLGVRDIAALTLVASHPGVPVDWLRTRVGLSQPGTVRLVDRLSAAGLIERAGREGRSVHLAVTPAGQELLDRWTAQRDQAVRGLTEGLAPGRQAELAELLAVALSTPGRPRAEADQACRTCDWPACGDDCPVSRSVRP